MVVVFENEILEVLHILEHNDPRVEELIDKIGYHLLIKEKSALEKITLWDIREVAQQSRDGLIIDCNWHGLSIAALGPAWVESAMNALRLFADIVESKSK